MVEVITNDPSVLVANSKIAIVYDESNCNEEQEDKSTVVLDVDQW